MDANKEIDKSNFKLSLPELDQIKWFHRVENDNNRFLSDISVKIDERGINGTDLFPLSLDITHQETIMNIRSLKVASGDTVDKEIFSALCPELENFVTFVNWLGSVESRNDKNLAFRSAIKRFLENKNGEKICSISGNYRIAKEDYARILPFRGDLEITVNSHSLGWEFAPYLKRTSETFMAYPSPIFTSPISDKSLGGDTLKEKRLFCFTAPFSLCYRELDELTLEIISGTTPKNGEIRVKNVLSAEKKDKLLLNKEKVFIGLFANIIEEGKNWNIYLINLSEQPLEDRELLAHLLITRLYYNFLSNQRSLKLCTLLELKSRIDKMVFQIKTFRNGKIEEVIFEDFWKKYLSPYFIIHLDNVYYLPHFLKHQSNFILEDFLEHFEKLAYLPKDNNFEKFLEIGIANMKKYESLVRATRFVIAYNIYSKRALMEIIKNNFNKKNGEWKWKI